MPCHQECKYHDFLGLVEWCRHPDHLEPLEPRRTLTIAAAGGKCASKIGWETKVMPGEVPAWQMPVNLCHLVAAIAVSLHVCGAAHPARLPHAGAQPKGEQ